MVNSIGVAAMAGIVLAAPEVGLVATMGTAATTVAYGELFNYLIENGSDKFVEYCALQGRTEAESVRYGTAAAGIVGKLLKVAVIRGGLKSIGGKKNGTVRTINTAEASAKAKELFHAKAANENAVIAKVTEETLSSISNAPFIQRQYRGGAYSSLKIIDKPHNIERHHIPANSISGISRGKGMAIQMEAEDHAKTSSFRNSLASRAYRKTIESKMMQGDIRGAIATEISDVKKHTGRKYNSALKEMLEYGIDNGLIPDKK